MKNPIYRFAVFFPGLLLFSSPVFAKDKPVGLAECPQAVQAVVQQYGAKATFEEIVMDKNKKSGGPVMYEAKFALSDGRRFEVHISPTGQVLAVEEKKVKQ
jgi:hypothetical protein